MKDLLLELITSYESKILTGIELIVAVYQYTITCDQDLLSFDESREILQNSLQETLAKNCFLRKKDFAQLMEGIFIDLDKKRVKIEEQRKEIKEGLDEYLKEQKQLASLLREEVIEFTQGKEDKRNIENVINKIKIAYDDRGEQIFEMFRSFRCRLQKFLKEQEKMNHKLQRLLERGKFLRIDDIRQLEKAKACQERMSERNIRREEVERMLTQFRQKRLGSRNQV